MTKAGEVLARFVAEGIVEFTTTAPELRDEARRSGWSGSLRGWLRHDGAAFPESIPEAVAALVPSLQVTPRPIPRGGVRALLRHAVAGLAGTAEVVVDDGSGLRPFTVRYPDRPDLFVEELARVIDVTVSVRARFGAAVGHVRLIAVDRSEEGFRSERTAAVASQTLGDIHFNASGFLPGGRNDRDLAVAARPPGEPPGGDLFAGDLPAGNGDVSAGVGAGVDTPADRTTAHELWHQIEDGFAARNYAGSIEFRRELGGYFGVETIEHAVVRPGPAHDRLVREVSAYAATNALEATAEMAELWWWRPDSPVGCHFGRAVDRFFPPPPPPTD